MSPRPTAAQIWKKKYEEQLIHRQRNEVQSAERIQQLRDELAAAKTNTNVMRQERYDMQQTLTRARAEHKEEVDALKIRLHQEVEDLNQKVADLRKWKKDAFNRCARYEQRIGVLTDSLRDVAVEKDILY